MLYMNEFFFSIRSIFCYYETDNRQAAPPDLKSQGKHREHNRFVHVLYYINKKDVKNNELLILSLICKRNEHNV